jgi:DNA-binding MarR family transcriptional regulator
LAKKKPSDWPGWFGGNPYCFSWRSPRQREQVLQILCKNYETNRIDYPAKDVLRDLLYRWRRAAKPRSGPRVLTETHWCFYSYEQLADDLIVDPATYKKAVARLNDKGLVKSHYEPINGKKAVTHHRPSDALWRVLTKLRQGRALPFITGMAGGPATLSKAEHAMWSLMDENLKNRHEQTALNLLEQFSASDLPDRDEQFCEAFDHLLEDVDVLRGGPEDEFADERAAYYDPENGG